MMNHGPDNPGNNPIKRLAITLAWRWSIFIRWFYDLTSLSGTSTPRITLVTLAWLAISACGVIVFARLGGLEYAGDTSRRAALACHYWTLVAYAADHAVLLLPGGARDDLVLTSTLWGRVTGVADALRPRRCGAERDFGAHLHRPHSAKLTFRPKTSASRVEPLRGGFAALDAEVLGRRMA